MVRKRFESFTGPQPFLGTWHDVIEWCAAWQGRPDPAVDRPLITVFAGTHAVAERFNPGQDITRLARKRVATLTDGTAGVAGISAELGAAFKVFEMGLEHPVADITRDEALTERDCAAAIAFGMEVVAEGADMVVLGNAGFGSATAAATIARALYGGASEYWAGAHNHTAEARIEAVSQASEKHRAAMSDPLEILRCVGGRDLAGAVGAIIACRHQRIPVILDGFVVCAAAAVLHALSSSAIAHCQAGHVTAEPAHPALLERLGLTPLNDFGITLGDGTGSALTLSNIRLALAGFKTLPDDT